MKNCSFRCAALCAAATLALWPSIVTAQVVTTNPAIITADTKNIEITFHTDWGNGGMANITSSTAVYAHTGLITNQSETPGEWTYAPTWPDNSAKYKLTYSAPHEWTLSIPDIRQYYGVTSSSVDIKQMVFVFRDAAGSNAQGKTINGGDISITVFPSGFPAPTAKAYPGGKPVQGVVASADGSSATFCFAAPEKEMVQLMGSWNDFELTPSQQMHYTDYNGIRYFWATVEGLKPSTDYTYYYLVDGQTAVGDPYARLVLDPNNDKYIPASVYPDMPAYPAEYVANVPVAVYNSDNGKYSWQVTDFQRPAQESLVIYEVLIRDFTGTEGKALGNGTIAGLIDKLDYIKGLGVNAIELLPVMEFDGNNSWGYNPNFYFAPDKAYGTPDDYRLLVDECHARGLAVILDVVFNQTAGLHPWYLMYPMVLSKFYNGTSPHAYSVLNDWNQQNDLVQQQFADALRHWLSEYRVDGFRFDLVKGLGDNDSYGNTYYEATNTWGTPSEPKTDAYNESRISRMAQLHAAISEIDPTAYFINEDLAGAQEENKLAENGDLNWANINNPACQFAMGYEEQSGLNRFYAPSDGGRLRGSTVSYAESHDEERMAYKQTKYGLSSLRSKTEMRMRRLGSVAAQMLMSPGAHMIWQFQEFGANQTTKNTDGSNNTNPKIVVWSNLNSIYNAALCQSYRDLLSIRNNNPELFGNESDATILLNGWAEGRTILLSSGDKKIIVAVNPLIDASIDIYIPSTINDTSKLRLLAASYNTSPSISNGNITVEPGAFAVYGTEEVSAIDDIYDDTDSTLPVSYYNLQGRPIASPAAGQIVIRRQGTKATKLIYK